MKNRIIRYIILGIIVSLVVCIFVPIILDHCVFGNNIPSNLTNGEWASFLGSFLGGVIGGTATLLAVIATIIINREEIDREDKKKRDERIEKNAVIVYYDLEFSIEDILSFMNEFWENKNCSNDTCLNSDDTCLNKEDMDLFVKTRSKLSQMYLDANWTERVAMLKDHEELDNSKIKTIYETYGNIMTVKKCLVSPNKEECENAYQAMLKIVEYDRGSETTKGKWVMKDNISTIMSKLESHWKDQKHEESKESGLKNLLSVQ